MVDLTDTPAPVPDTAPDLRPAAVDLTEVALDLHAQETTQATLDRMIATVGSLVPCDDAGVLLLTSRHGATTAAVTSEPVARAHGLQLELDEGPCLDAIEAEDGHYLVLDIRHEGRWPRWAAALSDLGYRSVVSIRLATHERPYGSLNLYSRTPGAFDEADLARTVAFGRVASVALATAQDVDGLQRAIDARRVIGIAMGILMERYDLEADPAFEVLRRYSQHHNIKLRDVARSLVERRELPET